MGLLACSSRLSFPGDTAVPPVVVEVPVGLWEWGIFSGRGCFEPMVVTPTSEALPALERA